MRKYYCITITMDADCGDAVSVHSDTKFVSVDVEITEANLNNAVELLSKVNVSLRKRKNSSEIFLNLYNREKRYWFGEEKEILDFFFFQGIHLTESSSGCYQASRRRKAVISIEGIQPIGLMLFPDNVDLFYDPELHSLPDSDYWQPHR